MRTTMIAIMTLAAVTAADSAGAAATRRGEAWITTKTKIALLADPDVDGTKLNVDATGSTVVLHGTLPTQAQKDRAVQVARGIEGVTTVRDLIVVGAKPAAKVQATSVGKVETPADDALRVDVQKALSIESLKDSKIRVESVKAGSVRISGTASSMGDQRIALARVRSVPGVTSVSSDVTTTDDTDMASWRERRLEGDKVVDRAGDAWITSAVKLRLLANTDTPGTAINVDTDDGVVTLFGKVPTEQSKAAAEAEAKSVDDVTKVVNVLQVVPESQSAAVARKDDEIATAVRAALRDGDRFDDANIDVEVKGGVVRLTGTVRSNDDRVAAAALARSTAGAKSVRQELKVTAAPATAATDAGKN